MLVHRHGLAAAAGVHAQTWPERPVTLVVNFPAGGSTDQIARAIGPRMSEKLKQPFVIDQKVGATGTIGATFVKRAAPDGYTLLVTSLGPLVIVPHLMKSMQYDALKDFEPITVAVQAPNVLVVPAACCTKTLDDVIKHLRPTRAKMTSARRATAPAITRRPSSSGC